MIVTEVEALLLITACLAAGLLPNQTLKIAVGAVTLAVTVLFFILVLVHR